MTRAAERAQRGLPVTEPSAVLRESSWQIPHVASLAFPSINKLTMDFQEYEFEQESNQAESENEEVAAEPEPEPSPYENPTQGTKYFFPHSFLPLSFIRRYNYHRF